MSSDTQIYEDGETSTKKPLPEQTDLPAYAVVQKSSPRMHLAFLDGIRGLAALYVVYCHAYLGAEAIPHPGSKPLAIAWGTLKLLSWGFVAVDVFIVLSGYCLMLPVVGSSDKRLRGGTLAYIKRRTRRILPPYYAALALSLVLIVTLAVLPKPMGTGWDPALPAFGRGNLLAHLTLTHNLSYAWSHSIDSPMWSMATEWDIYFIFALLLLPVWRRWGNSVMLTVAFGAGLLPHFLFGSGYSLDWACPWFIGLFALGMVAATIVPTSDETLFAKMLAKWSVRWTVGLLVAACILGGLAYLVSAKLPRSFHTMPFDVVVGFGTMGLILYCSHYAARRGTNRVKAPLVLRLLESKGLVKLGLFSYSVYLIHYPIIAVMYRTLRAHNWSVNVVTGLILVVGIPLTFVLAYVFHLVFERRFIAGSSRRLQSAAPINARQISENGD